MIVIETCPKCGHDLQDLVIATYPPIPKKECWNCGWSWTGKQEEIVRTPFSENGIANDCFAITSNHFRDVTEEELQNLIAKNLKDVIADNLNLSR